MFERGGYRIISDFIPQVKYILQKLSIKEWDRKAEIDALTI
jgi:hypothetical protein